MRHAHVSKLVKFVHIGDDKEAHQRDMHDLLHMMLHMPQTKKIFPDAEQREEVCRIANAKFLFDHGTCGSFVSHMSMSSFQNQDCNASIASKSAHALVKNYLSPAMRQTLPRCSEKNGRSFLSGACAILSADLP